MIELARPAFLWAGALAAGVPLLLHFLRPRERSRRALPTLRFLTEESRVRIHLARRPDELLLLLLRMALCFLLGAAFAGASWIGPEEGTGTLVVVDVGAGMEGAWADGDPEALRAAALDGLEHPLAALTLVRAGAGGIPEVRRLGPGEAAEALAWTDFRPTEGEVRLAHLLRALRDDAALITGFDSLAARVVSLPRWTAWGVGLPELRTAHWPGAIELVAPPVPSIPPPAVIVEWTAPETVDEPVQQALEVLGLGTDRPPSPDTLRVVLHVGSEDSLGELWAPGAAQARAVSPVEGAFLLLDGRILEGAGPSPEGTPAEGTTVPVLRAGGVPAGAARRAGGRCEVALPLSGDAGIVGSGELPLLLESAIAEGCGITPATLAGLPDDAEGAVDAWSRLLRGAGLPGVVKASTVRGEEAGTSLTRLLLALALLVVLLETLRTRASDRRRAG
ncbi:MAG: BatA domain-containing protein [Gemmatimonadota bacterium]